MWFLPGLLLSVLIQECVSQGTGFPGRDGFSGQSFSPTRGFGGSPGGADVGVRTRGGGFGASDQFGGGTRRSGGGGGGNVPIDGECPRDRRIEGIMCAGRGPNVMDCPTDSTCMRDRASGGAFCCWDNTSPIEAPCEDPMMNGGSFAQCTPGDASNACPGSCHRCQALGGGIGMGLCCPQVTRRGCENSSPMRNAYEAATRRITGGGGSTSTSMNTGSQGLGPGPSSLGTDFGMTSGSTGANSQRVVCPDGVPPSRGCSATSPCTQGQACLAITATSGGCCEISSGRSGFPGSSRMTMGGQGGFMSGGGSSQGMSGLSGGTGGMMSGGSGGMDRGGEVCPGGLPAAGRCFRDLDCGGEMTCMRGACCPYGPGGGMGGGRGFPGMPGGPGRFGPGAPDGFGPPGGARGRIPPEFMDRRRALARRRMLRPPFGMGARF